MFDRKSRNFSPSKHCDAVRLFLYDMGLLDRKTFGHDFVAIDAKGAIDFYQALHHTVDRQPVKKNETVFIFYVRKNQRNHLDILKNTVSVIRFFL